MIKIGWKDIAIIIVVFLILAVIETIIIFLNAYLEFIPGMGMGVLVSWVFILQVMVAILTCAAFFKKK